MQLYNVIARAVLFRPWQSPNNQEIASSQKARALLAMTLEWPNKKSPQKIGGICERGEARTLNK
jgi:hypothetical protein